METNQRTSLELIPRERQQAVMFKMQADVGAISTVYSASPTAQYSMRGGHSSTFRAKISENERRCAHPRSYLKFYSEANCYGD
ncbi:hypothetical protein GN244_ATG17243 [Phytophthora infestans]|uniref:Uncharacterized protein n=1 Tax=Phytophthora infestans TaxID=4787 RepID=A0A833WEK6_PHYIN|nr:hypothetical protein GN244_ATG17243 [Phytophthora infestans]KAF4127048.1 hypothetical protein GN958_ATG23760 [Phytophthora infestans]